MTGADRQRLRQVRAAILGNRPDNSLSSALYPVYVAVIAAGTYGIPASQQLFRSLDKRWLAEHVGTPAGAVVAVTLAALLLTLVRLVGRFHGPVVPPLPYLEMVVTSPIPRKVTLARHWRLSLGGATIGGLLTGAVCGAGLAIAGVAQPIVLLPATLSGPCSACSSPSSGCRVSCTASFRRRHWSRGVAHRSSADAEMRWHDWTSPVCGDRLPAMSPSAEPPSPGISAPFGWMPPGRPPMPGTCA